MLSSTLGSGKIRHVQNLPTPLRTSTHRLTLNYTQKKRNKELIMEIAVALRGHQILAKQLCLLLELKLVLRNQF